MEQKICLKCNYSLLLCSCDEITEPAFDYDDEELIVNEKEEMEFKDLEELG